MHALHIHQHFATTSPPAPPLQNVNFDDERFKSYVIRAHELRARIEVRVQLVGLCICFYVFYTCLECAYVVCCIILFDHLLLVFS